MSWVEPVRDAPLTLSRLRCANPDTVEWRLGWSGSGLALVIVWLGREATAEQALGRLLMKALESLPEADGR